MHLENQQLQLLLLARRQIGKVSLVRKYINYSRREKESFDEGSAKKNST
jgi:hypothetical protein